IDDETVARTGGRHRRTRLPRVAPGKVGVMQPRVVFERVEPAADDVERVAERDGARVIARTWERLSRFPALRLWIIDFMPCNTRAFAGGLARAADQMNLAVERDGRRGAARSRQWRNARPTIGRDVVRVSVIIRMAILFGKSAKRVHATRIR